MNRLVRCSILALLAIAGSAVPSTQLFAQFRDWNTTDGSWSDSSNWNPNLAPGITEIGRIGNLPSAHSANVDLDIHTAISGLQIYDGMAVRTNGYSLTTAFDTLVTGYNERSSELRIESSNFHTRNLTNQAYVTLLSGNAHVSGLLENADGAVLLGGGTVHLTRDSGIALRNDGLLYSVGANPLTINQSGVGLMDLDGTSGNGSIVAGPSPTNMSFHGTQLSDSFSGTIRIQSGDTLDMDFSEGWTADANSTVTVTGRGDGTLATIQGGNWTLQGSLLVESSPLLGPGALIIEAATRIGSQSNTMVQTDNTVSFAGPVTLDGGHVALEEDAELSFNSNTLVNAATFTTQSNIGSDGSIAFNGITAWQGNVSISGIARQNGNAVVTGNTIINAGVFDMDGLGNTNWTVNSALSVNADGIDSTISNSFDGTLNVQGGLSSHLSINLGQPDQHWTMAGEMNLSNALNLGVYRLHGSEMRVTGDLNIDGTVGSTADMVLGNPALVTFADPDSVLYSAGVTRVEQQTTFMGEGTLHSLASGELVLADGAALDDVDVVNQGVFRIGDSAGIASVDHIDLMIDGSWAVEIGGYISGDEFDHLLVGDMATLGGLLEVDLIDSGMGLFAPVRVRFGHVHRDYSASGTGRFRGADIFGCSADDRSAGMDAYPPAGRIDRQQWLLPDTGGPGR